METFLDFLPWYLLIINLFSFALFTIDRLFHDITGKSLGPEWIFWISTIVGGSIGANLYFLLFFNKFETKGFTHNQIRGPKDDYTYWRVFAIVMLIIHIIVFLWLYRIRIPVFINDMSLVYKVVVVYLAIINVITMIVFGIDKRKAVEGEYRIREIHLFLLAAIGGTIGGLIGMHLFRHKTSKMSFVRGFPLIFLAQVVLFLFFLASSKM